jgi:LPPG:FO 2-phospho-L-lactate transferase
VGDTFHNAEALRRYGSGWFGIGDADLATHLTRTSRLAGGATLTEATASVSAALRTGARVLPMSDDPVRTVVVTPEGRLPFQEYLVKHRAAPTVVGVDHDGLDKARPAPGVVEAVAGADLLVIAPSNPVASIGPILALPDVREAIAARRDRTVAVTPVVSGQEPATGPERSRAAVRCAFMAARGLHHRATDVARIYAGTADRFVLDRRDSAETAAIEDLGFEVMLADTLAPARERPGLAAAVVAFGISTER